MPEFDVVVLGGGPGGYVAAIRAAQLGRTVCLVEKGQLGGTCLNRGCIPTKALVSSSHALAMARRLSEFGVDVGEARPRFDRMLARKDQIVARLRAGVAWLLKKNKVTVVSGVGRLAGRGRVELDAAGGPSRVEARHVIVATGSEPIVFPSFGYDGRTVVTSEEALEFPDVPGSLLIVGGGVIGCELAFVFSSLGTKVTVVDVMPTVLPGEDPDCAAAVAASLASRGVELRTGVRIERIAPSDDGGGVVATLEDGGRLEAERALISVGRRPSSEQIGLEGAGVATGPKGEILVNERMETSAPGVYAVGDVVGKAMLAHVASAQGIVAAHNVSGGDRRMAYHAIPVAIFTSPEVASVGLGERRAREEGMDVRVGKFPFSASGRARAMGETEGFVKVIADAGTDRMLGVHIVGPCASELISEPAAAVRMRLTVAQFAEAVRAHPTLAEAIGEAADAVHGLAIHV